MIVLSVLSNCPAVYLHFKNSSNIPLLVHFENILKKNEAQYQSVRPVSPIPSHRRLGFGTKPKHLTDAKSRSHNLKRYARSLLSAKYRNKKKHFRKHKLVFGKWRKLHSKSSFHSRDRFRRFSIASSGSSHDSPVPSPMSAYDDGSGYDARRRRDDNQFDIDDVIIPYSNKRGRLVKFEFKDIEIPSWRSIAFDDLKSIDIEEDTSDAAFIKRHEGYEVEERKIIRNGGGALCFFNTWQKRARRQHRSDSRADSSGANTPDPVLICDQDILFQDTNSMLASSPLSPALSPPTTPSSANLISDDSQPPLGNVKKKTSGAKRQEESTTRANATDYDEITPYEPRSFPLPERMVEELLAESDHNRDDTDVTASGPSCPASPASTTTSTSTVEEDDVTDPEWRVVKRESGPEQALVLKFAKR
ncbi:kansl1l [Trichonephila clavipes]|nr:kansl1l [Trichonephila clavipes]